MTEQEAKSLWCPFARYTSVRGTAINRWVDGEEGAQLSPEPAKCIASACMAWRGRKLATYVGVHPQPPIEVEHGHCGLAGSPQ